MLTQTVPDDHTFLQPFSATDPLSVSAMPSVPTQSEARKYSELAREMVRELRASPARSYQRQATIVIRCCQLGRPVDCPARTVANAAYVWGTTKEPGVLQALLDLLDQAEFGRGDCIVTYAHLSI